jgi:CheY-like chemotaxis protein
MTPRLLLVDDEPDIRQIARIALERIGGWTVVEACSAETAIDVVATESPFDAVVLDVMMPGLDGPATLRMLRDGRLAPGTPVVFMTARAQLEDRQRLAALGAAGTIAKPFDPITLPAQLQQILDGCAGRAAA